MLQPDSLLTVPCSWGPPCSFMNLAVPTAILYSDQVLPMLFWMMPPFPVFSLRHKGHPGWVLAPKPLHQLHIPAMPERKGTFITLHTTC